MSSLAPFVAATIRDKVVEDLMEENERLRNELKANRRASHSIKITSDEQLSLYSEGNFMDGHFWRGNNNLWVVPLETKREAPVEALKSFELHYGEGPTLVSQVNREANGHLTVDTFRSRTEDSLPVELNFNYGHIRVICVVKQWPSPEILQAFVDMPTQSTAARIKALVMLSQEYIEMVVEFATVVLSCGELISSDIFDAMSLEGDQLERLKKQRLYRVVYKATLRIYVTKYDGYNANDHDLSQYISTMADELVEEGLTDAESEQFRQAVLDTFPVFRTNARVE